MGAAYVEAAADAGATARPSDPEGDAALQLGYLLGAVKRSEAGAQGVGLRARAGGCRPRRRACPRGSAAFDARQAGRTWKGG